ncbi:MAG: hypothetical protein ACYCR2_07935 [Thermoplasmataceae archaeon]
MEPEYQYILEKLGIPPDAKVVREYPIVVGDRELLVDIAVKSRDTLTLIEVKPRINEDTIYRIYALSHLIGVKPEERKRMRLVCAGKSLKYSTQELASKLGIETLIIPPKLYHSFVPTGTISKEILPYDHIKLSPSRITSEKAWKIVCTILADKPQNILALSKQTGISYGWTNTIVHKLENSEIIPRGYGLTVKDVDRLLNAVSWERPLEALHVETVNTGFKTATDCINEVALNLNKQGVDYAFTAHSSATYYGSSIIRDDFAYIYIPDALERNFLRTYSVEETSGCALKMYVPDRDVMKSSKVFNGIRVVDHCQNLLDLAGLGTDGRTSAKDLVNKIGRKGRY